MIEVYFIILPCKTFTKERCEENFFSLQNFGGSMATIFQLYTKVCNVPCIRKLSKL